MGTLTCADRDLHHIWHPCSQMKDDASFKPLEIKSATGSYIELADGRKIIDAIASWWCKSLGHQHPRLKKVILKQIEKFEHVIFANTTNEPIVALAEKLTGFTKKLKKIFFAGDGSSAVEVAIKMSLHARQLTGEVNRKQFIALKNAYHGETIATLSVSDVGMYKKPYEALLFDTHFITPPYVFTQQDPRWTDCEVEWLVIEKELNAHAHKVTAIIVEPILQGAGGMKIYSQDFLKRLRRWATENGIHLIADEIMTGIGRTGKLFACEHADIEPDFMCLSKGLTGGWLPFSAILTRNAIYDLFYDDYESNKAFLHSHTFSGNVLGACLALEVLNCVDEYQLCNYANELGQVMLTCMQNIASETASITNIRQLGCMVAADLIAPGRKRAGYQVYQQAVKLGALLRPLGNTIYWLPPLNTSIATIEELSAITKEAIQTVILSNSLQQ